MLLHLFHQLLDKASLVTLLYRHMFLLMKIAESVGAPLGCDAFLEAYKNCKASRARPAPAGSHGINPALRQPRGPAGGSMLPGVHR